MTQKSLIIAYFLLLFVSFYARSQENKQLVWEENFNGADLDTLHWNYITGNGCPELCGWGNNERQVYRKENINLADGKLVITAQKQNEHYYSGRINTKDKREFKYGTFIISAKVPGGWGIWPAIWMLGDNIDQVGWPASGEIDIMEFIGRQPDTLHTTLHSPAHYGETASTQATAIKNITDDFHKYKIDWNKDAIVFYIDNQKVFTYSPEQKTEENYPFQHPFYFLLNMAVGGNFGGPEVDDSLFPAKFYIDYIKVYQ